MFDLRRTRAPSPHHRRPEAIFSSRSGSCLPMSFPLPTDEAGRLAALERYDTLDTPPEESFDRIARLARRLFDVPIALVSFVHTDRQWFKACTGLDVHETPRHVSFCTYTILSPEVMVVEDATADPRFAANPLVTGAPGIRFYAGAPLTTKEGHRLGTICLIDQQPRRFDAADRAALADLAAMVMDTLELRQELRERALIEAERSRHARLLETSNENLHRLHQVLTHASGGVQEQMQAYLRAGCRIFGMSTGIVSRVEGDTYTVLAVESPFEALQPGLVFPLGETYCAAVIRDGCTIGYTHVGRMEEMCEHPVYQAMKLESYLSTPLIVDGTLYGTLNFTSTEPRAQEFTDQDFNLIELMAQSISRMIALEDHDHTRRQVEAALRESEERFRQAFDFAAIGMALVGPDGRWLKVNRAVCDLLGYTEDELLRIDFQTITHPDDLEADLDLVRQMLDGTIQTYQMEKRYFHKNGAIVWALLSVSLVRDHDGTPLYFISQIQDITERKQAEAALKESERRFRAIFNSTFQFIGLMAPGGTMLEANETLLTFTGLAPEQIIGKPLQEIPWWPPEMRERIREAVAQAGRGTFVRFDLEVHGAHGRREIIDFSINPVRDENGRVVLLIPEGRVISEVVAVRKHLERAHRFTEALLDSLEVGIVACDADGTLTLFNTAARRFHGMEASPLPPEQWAEHFDLYHADGRTLMAKEDVPLFRALHGGTVHNAEMVIAPANLPARTLLASGRSFFDGNGNKLGAVVAMTDITERKQAEQALRASEERLAMAVDAADLGLWDLDFTTGRHIVNERWVRMLGYTAEEVEPTLAFFERHVHPDDRARVREALDRHLAGETERMQTEMRLRARDGSWRWILDMGKLVTRTPNGEPLRAVGVHLDITERKQAEAALKRLNAALTRRNADLQAANEDIKRFAYIVSHDLRAPLVNLRGFTEELSMAIGTLRDAFATAAPTLDESRREAVRLALEEDIPEAMQFIQAAIDRMDQDTRAVLHLSRIGRRELTFEPVDMDALTRRVLATLAHQIEAQHITVEIEPLPVVQADAVSMEQVMSNLLGNAIRYMVPGRPGHIRIRAERTEEGTTFAIEDNGRGIPEQDLERVFDLFRRGSNTTSEGEGMGLAYARKILQRHGGSLWCHSTLHQGSTFFFSLPSDPGHEWTSTDLSAD
ncbi:MAG: PAS domain S-box protein [Bacteroidetes bacterium]|nr:MAG: PAS domain S-box protein [Bacteroidota bacterium]